MSDRLTALKGTTPPKLPPTLPTNTHGFLLPSQAERHGFVFAELENFVRCALVTLTVPSLHQTAENIIVVSGKPGSGKTHAILQAVLKAGNGWAYYELPPSMLSSENEGGAVKPLQDALDQAVQFSAQHQLRVAIGMNDIELSILPTAAANPLGATVNKPLLEGKLQAFTEKPRKYVCYDGTPIPLIFTTNDLSGFRSSLLRTARADIYTHTPTRDERLAFAEAMLKPRTLRERHRVGWVFRAFADQPVSFWVALSTALKKGTLRDLIERGITDPSELQRELGRPLPLQFRRLFSLALRMTAKRNRSHL